MTIIVGSNTDEFRFIDGYNIHIFRTVGTKNIIFAEGGFVDLLIVGGGGSGSNANNNFSPSGGGGGGEVVELTRIAVGAGSHTVTVGAGVLNSNGGISSFSNIQVNGGGWGGNAGGSGGGARRNELINFPSVRLHPDGMGNQGGRGIPSGGTGGADEGGAAGGGGATAPGATVISNFRGSAGGQGYTSLFSGVAEVYGSGGGGGSRNFAGGLGGTNAGNGGNGEETSQADANGKAGVNGYGGGGGGGGGGNANNSGIVGLGGRGGSGVVIIRYPYKLQIPISLGNVEAAFNLGSSMSAYRSYKAMIDGIQKTLPSGAISFSDFNTTSRGVATSNMTFYYDPANTSSYSGTGTTLSNLSGVANNATILNGAFVNSNKQVVMENFDNGPFNRYMITTATHTFNNSTPYTFECWFWQSNVQTALARQYVMGLDNINTGLGIFIEKISDIDYIYATENDATFVDTINTPNTWLHLVMSANLSTFDFYVNGILKGSTTRPANVSYSGPIGIGGYNSGSLINGKYGPCRMYARALTHAEILRNYNAETGRSSLLS